MVISIHNLGLSPSDSPPIPLRPLSQVVKPARLKPLVDSMQFSGKQPRTVPVDSQPPGAGFFSKERFTGAWRSVKHDLTSKDWWLKNGAIAAAVTLATCWLPGSQLFTIPLWLGIDALFSAIRGHQHYQDFPEKPTANIPQNPATQTSPCTQTPKQKQWSSKDQRSAAWKGLKQGIKDGFCHKFKLKALVSGALCLATCWLPGSQLLLIPSLFCTFAAWEGVNKAIEGYQNPRQYIDTSETSSQQAGKTKAQ